jgi:hypothetical protein
VSRYRDFTEQSEKPSPVSAARRRKGKNEACCTASATILCLMKRALPLRFNGAPRQMHARL